MSSIDDNREGDFFVNREAELAWLSERTIYKRGNTIGISGPAGIGKTALLRQFLRTNSIEGRSVSLSGYGNPIDLDRLRYTIRNFRNPTRVVILDDAEFSKNDIEQTERAVFNWKAVRTLFLVQRNSLSVAREDRLNLGPLSHVSSAELFRLILGDRRVRIPDSLLDAAEGHPLAIRLISGLAQSANDLEGLARSLQGSIYQLKNEILVPQRQVITNVRPQLVRANEQLLERLKARPTDVHQIEPRKFEELVAELLDDMDFDVELTPPTRDGGRDVLAYVNTPIGRLLTLVEVKKYRPDRSVGIQLVKNLYGTLMDEQANSGMLVTTSDFSADARKFQQRHQWQLSLKNYTDLVQWIENYKKPKLKEGQA
jgi:restriction system protein